MPEDTADERIRECVLPSITMVIPVLNEAQYILDTLRQLSNQDFPRELLRIIVVDGGSSDSTRELVREFIASTSSTVELINNPKQLSSCGRNLGICRSNSDYVLFVDGHVFIPSDQMLHDMAMATVAHGALVLGRPQPLDAPELSNIQTATAGVRSSPLGHSLESLVYSEAEGWVSPLSVGVMYKRSLFARFGMFDESFDAAEDVEFNCRLEKAGIRAFISPRFRVCYYPRKTLAGLFMQMRRYGEGRTRFLFKHPQRFRAEIFLPLLSCLALLTTLGLAFFEPLRPVVLWSTLATLILVMVSLSRHIARGRYVALAIAPLCLVTVHLGLGIGVLKGLISGIASAPWSSRAAVEPEL